MDVSFTFLIFLGTWAMLLWLCIGLVGEVRVGSLVRMESPGVASGYFEWVGS